MLSYEEFTKNDNKSTNETDYTKKDQGDYRRMMNEEFTLGAIMRKSDDEIINKMNIISRKYLKKNKGDTELGQMLLLLAGLVVKEIDD